jgi:hypothetical protein
MSLKLALSVSRKIGQPHFSSLGAICGVELELDASILERDLDSFQKRARDAYGACAQAVNDELARQQARLAGPPVNGYARSEERVRTNGTDHRSTRPATPAQVRAIRAIASRQQIDLPGLLHNCYGVKTADELSVAEASHLIDDLQGAANGEALTS